MTDASEALARLSQNVDNLTSEVGEISNVLANLPTSEDPAIAAGINEAADRLSALRESLESATQLDDPAEQPPAEGETGDQPPASAPPEGEAGNTVA